MRSHFSRDASLKLRLLTRFKKAVSSWDPEFQDLHQKVCNVVSWSDFFTTYWEFVSKLVPKLSVKPVCDFVCVSAGCSWVPHLRVEPHEVFAPTAAAESSQHGQGVQLPGGGSHGVQDAEHQDLIDYWCSCNNAKADFIIVVGLLLYFNSIVFCTCSCGSRSTREEEYTNLSLNLLPGGGTVEDLLEDYLKVRNTSP